MKTKYRYIHFVKLGESEKTSKWGCLNNSDDNPIGTIRWYAQWRQYCFFPSSHTVFNKGCLEDINDFITQSMDERSK